MACIHLIGTDEPGFFCRTCGELTCANCDCACFACECPCHEGTIVHHGETD